MSQTRGSREDGRPDILCFLDGSDGPLEVPKFAHRVGVVSAYSEDGTPIVKDSDEGTLDYRCLRWHDLQQKTSQGLPDRRLSVQHFVDFGAEYANDRDKDAPYEQAENFIATNRTTRWADGSGRVALPTSFSRLIGSEDGRDAVALAIRGPVMGEPDEVDVVTDPEALNASGLPEGVSFHGTGAVSGTGGTVSASQPRVVVGGLSFFGAAAVNAAAKVAQAGGTLQQIRDAARAAAFGLPQPPFTPQGTKTRPPAQARNPDGSVVPNNHPLGYMWEETPNRIGLMGTLFTAGALDADRFYFKGREGTPINRLATRHDGHVAMSETRTGRVHFVPTEISGVSEGDGDLVKGWMMHDASKANTDTEVGQETGQWRPVVRVGLKDITTRYPPPPFPPQPPRVQPPPFPPPEEDEEDEETDTGFDPFDTGFPTGLPGDPFTSTPGPSVYSVASGAPGPALTSINGGVGHLAIVSAGGGSQLVIGSAAQPPPIPLGLPGGLGTGGPITDSGFDGDLPLGLPGGAGGGFGFEPQPESGGLTQSEADAANADRAEAREAARQEALKAEQQAINDLRAKAEATGGRAGARMKARADRAQRNRDQREARRQKREDYKRRKREEREARRRRREEARRKKRERREAAAAAAARGAEDRKAEAKAADLFGSVGYVIDVTNPDAPVTFGDSGLSAQDEAERRRVLGGGSGLGSLGVVGGNTATKPLLPIGSAGGPKNLEGWTALATYTINSQQVITTGAFGGSGFLNAPINVVEVVEDGKSPTGSTLGQQIIAAGGGTRKVFGTPPLHIVGGVHAEPGSNLEVGGAGLITVTRPKTGGGIVTDARPGIFIPPPGGFGSGPGAPPKPPKPSDPNKPDAIVVGEGGAAGAFVVHSGGAATTPSVTVAVPAGSGGTTPGGGKPGISIGVIEGSSGTIYGTPAWGVSPIGTTTTKTTPEVPAASPAPGTVETYSVGQALAIAGAAGGATIVGGGFIGFGTPIKADDGTGGSTTGVGHVSNGVTLTTGPLGGIKAGGTDENGDPTGGPTAELGADDGHFFTGNVSIVGKLDVSGRFDPTTIEIADQTTDDIPNGTAGLRYNSASNARPIWKQAASPYTQGPLALYSDVTAISGGPTTLKKTSDQTTASTAYVDVTGLSFSVSANTDYAFTFYVVIQSSGTTNGYGVSLNGPAAPTALSYRTEYQASAEANGTEYTASTYRHDTAYDAMPAMISTQAANTDRYVQITGRLRNGANAGTLTVRAVSETALNITVMRGSWGTYF